MLHAHTVDPLYRLDHSDEQLALVDALTFNAQDREWLVYCALGDHPYHDAPDRDSRTGLGRPLLYGESA
ncbi:hypothetical protein JQX08_05520 [Pseudomonas sp. UL073]|uniref:Uncharacterized protein n=1 Tax=Zestomonas insulae TaxID=2809017 RepID=A0ABS2IAM2_9GAMM|nr:hypothetical protein [Pseudomonas insulae]MBM7060161.1 hypothetical protein [Pseudomonas insulae]